MVETDDRHAVRVLLVEDSLPVRSRVRGLIEELGIEIVGEAGSIAAALDFFLEHRPEALVLDLNLEDGSGLTVLRLVKRIQPVCVVIVLTNFGDDSRQLALRLGADYFFEKARDLDKVLEVLAKLQQKSRGNE